jgi:chloramphenicol 3-O-phosphotransferase
MMVDGSTHPRWLADAPPRIVVITGVMAAGKSTVARALAARWARGAHVEADAFQRMIVSGGVWPTEPGVPEGAAADQLRLRLRNMCQVAIGFHAAGFTAVLDDIILGERWQQLQADLAGYPISLVVLAPSVAVVQARDRARPQRTVGAAWTEYLDRELRETMAGHGIWVDSSEMTVDETVDAIVARLRPSVHGPD